MITFCILVYGDEVQYFTRLKESLLNQINMETSRQYAVIVGMNAPSDALYIAVDDFCARLTTKERVQASHVRATYDKTDCGNIGKYPMMRAMFTAVTDGSNVMWFDADSYINNFRGTDTRGFFNSIEMYLQNYEVIGKRYLIARNPTYSPSQVEAITKQPWYTGKDITGDYVLEFVPGSWFCFSAAFMRRKVFPFKDLMHNGGDIMLGEYLRQQAIPVMYDTHSFVRINKALNDDGVDPYDNFTALSRGLSLNRRELWRENDNIIRPSADTQLTVRHFLSKTEATTVDMQLNLQEAYREN